MNKKAAAPDLVVNRLIAQNGRSSKQRVPMRGLLEKATEKGANTSEDVFLHSTGESDHQAAE